MPNQAKIKIVECPRDAMQGWPEQIPTDVKVRYLNALLKVGFDTLDFGSFVSAKAIPQLSDTKEVLKQLDLKGSSTKLLAIIANKRGAEEAAIYDEIKFLGYPFSISETFQLRNTNSTIQDSMKLVEEIQSICRQSGKQLVIYISMGFGNPYGDPWNSEIAINYVKSIAELGVTTISLADTVGVSTPENIRHLFGALIPEFPSVEFGAHLHSHPNNWEEKIRACAESGVFRYDTAMRGIGGCPMADDVLVGNIATENVVRYFGGVSSMGLDENAFRLAGSMAMEVFDKKVTTP